MFVRRGYGAENRAIARPPIKRQTVAASMPHRALPPSDVTSVMRIDTTRSQSSTVPRSPRTFTVPWYGNRSPNRAFPLVFAVACDDRVGGCL